MFHHGFIYGIGSTYVLDDGSNIDRYGRRCWNLTTDNGINQLFLTTLRIALLQGNHLYFIFRSGKRLGTLLSQEGNGLGLVGFYADIAFGHLGSNHQQLQAYENLIGLLHHQPIVGSNVGFTLHGIDDHALGFRRWRRREFDKGGETSTTHTYNTCILDQVDNAVRRQFRMVLHRL